MGIKLSSIFFICFATVACPEDRPKKVNCLTKYRKCREKKNITKKGLLVCKSKYRKCLMIKEYHGNQIKSQCSE